MEESMKRRIVLFDFDGVIADSKALAYEVNKMICPHLTEEDFRKRFEGNINDWQEPNHTSECRLDIDFFALYAPKLKEKTAVVPGMDEVIAKLADSHILIVVSSTITSPIQEFLNMHELSRYFREIMGSDVHSSKVEKIKMVFSKYTAEPADCVFITDTLGDMREAEKTEVGSIGVLWGFHDKDRLLRGNPFSIVEKPENLVSAAQNYFRKN